MQTTRPARAAPNIWHAGAVLSLLMAFASVSTDFYLPAMPAMADDLGVGPGAMEFTVSTYLVGLSIGQLIWGPISDALGRRGPVAVGLVLFIAGSVGCGLSESIGSMVGWRLLQAFGAASSVVLSRAMVRDLYTGARAAQMMSIIMAVMTLAPVIAPSAGALVAGAYGWRMIFALLVVIGLVALAALATLPEPLAPAARTPELRLGRAFRTYGQIALNPAVLCHALAVGFFYIGMFAYVAGTPFVFIEYHGLSPQAYGLLFAACVGAITTGNLVNSRIVARLGTLRVLQLGGAAAALFGLLAAVAGLTDFGGWIGIFLPLFCFLGCTGLVMPNGLSGALDVAVRDAGSVAAFCGALQYGGGILGSALVGLLANGTAGPFGLVLALAGLSCFATTWILGRLPAVARR
ncbi:multidrug effflux MFS transporter [Ferrimonas balearica]|nr:multidrug effflux MFS transporter [Ferrimonas balearica]